MILCVCPNPSIDTQVWIDEFEPGKVHRAKQEKRYPGGKGVHVALALAELGSKARLLGFWGGPSGAWIRQQCESAGVHCVGPGVDEWNRTCMTLKSDGVYDETELLGVGPRIKKEDCSAFRKGFLQELDTVSAVTLSGSWPPGAPRGSYADLVAACSARSIRTYIDCSGEELKLTFKERPDCIHVNQTEATGLFGSMDPQKAAEELHRHCKLAVVTCGAEGAYFLSDGVAAHAQCSIASVRSSVGSGDCLLAGVAAAHEQGCDFEAMIRLAAASGAANCLREELGMLRSSDVEALVPQVKVTWL
ncbi:MAG: 1-phosphofructokinase family hexose kinase [Candidatus Sumerlaeaceae bacterium]